jgi:mannitol-specific phosphotransferase system IIBC component
MESNAGTDVSTKAGTLGGTLFILLLHIASGEVLKTAVLAAVGASVSFAVSYLLNRIIKKRKTR